MKKITTYLFVLIFVTSMFFCTSTYANEAVTNNDEVKSNDTANSTKTSTESMYEKRDKELKNLEDYRLDYGDSYGLAAYILSRISLFSIPICLVGIAISAIYQSVIGIRKLDYQERGLHLMVSFITVLVICQVLPLVFTIIVKGWRG